MKNLTLDHIQKMEAYHPPVEGRFYFDGVALDFNERTTRTSQKIFDSLNQLLHSGNWNRYPEYGNLCAKIADYAGVQKEQVLTVNGSDHGIDLIFRTFTQAEDQVIIPAPSFALFFQAAQIAKNKIVSPLYHQEHFAFPIQQILEQITDQTKLIVVCNPNNPTGTAVDLNEIEAILKKAPHAIVYVDEAYFEFLQESAIPLISQYPNLMISRTFSKAFGLAGLRIGYILCSQIYTKELLKVRSPYDVNCFASCAASIALDDLQDMQSYAYHVMYQSKPLLENFLQNHNIKFYPSQSNFLLFIPHDVEEVYCYLKNHGILTRPQRHYLLQKMLRVSIGTLEQTEHLIQVYSHSGFLKKSL